MPNQRSEKMRMLALWVTPQQMKLLDKLSRSMGAKSRSEAVRVILFGEEPHEHGVTSD